ncbi:m-AAA protease-interacting protein 1, mitochondrial [Manduca sexta]|uniref:m-AAA protease-interacting protein 1, mitochondrial n=1 Tax=Manduca sexta TaxID=7130 RepID=UPI00188E8778|nr:m-AAA protease-interacting protein 1, mitochondrial [Manduca sexta]
MAVSTKLFKGFRPIAPLFATLANHYLPLSKAYLTSQSFSCGTCYFKHELPKYFRHLEPPRGLNNYPNLFLSSNNALSFFKGLAKPFTFKRKDKGPKKQKKRVPKLILLQNPLTWLMIKIDFGVLKNIWDSTFEEKEFKYGTKQAISRVTHAISEGQYTELNGLLTKAARLSLMRELDRNWSDKQRSLLALNLEDIQISSARKVYFIRIADKKFCDVDMAFLALKWAPINNIEALIFTEIFARFHREYTPHCIPEWTIAYFKVTRFEVLRR